MWCDGWSSSSHLMILRMENVCYRCSMFRKKQQKDRSLMTSWSCRTSLGPPPTSRLPSYKRIKLQIIKATIFMFILTDQPYNSTLLPFLWAKKKKCWSFLNNVLLLLGTQKMHVRNTFEHSYAIAAIPCFCCQNCQSKDYKCRGITSVAVPMGQANRVHQEVLGVLELPFCLFFPSKY